MGTDDTILTPEEESKEQPVPVDHAAENIRLKEQNDSLIAEIQALRNDMLAMEEEKRQMRAQIEAEFQSKFDELNRNNTQELD